MTGKEIVTGMRSTILEIACEYPRDSCATTPQRYDEGWTMCDSCAARRRLGVLIDRLETALNDAGVP